MYAIIDTFLRYITNRSCVSQIYFEIASTLKNQSSNFLGFTVLGLKPAGPCFMFSVF